MQAKDTRYTPEQMQLVSEFVQDYGIEPDQIVFFDTNPKPTFDAEAAAHLARTLAGAKGVAIGPAAVEIPDTIRMECGLTFDGFFSSGTGSAHVKELVGGEEMSIPQLERLASSRAIRSALVYAGIDLLKLHRQRRSGVRQFTGPDKTNRERLLSRVHALGQEVGLISSQGNKSLWQAALNNRYGVDSSSQLKDEGLEDLAAFLSSLRPPQQEKKAA